MKKKTSLSDEDQALFRQLMTGTRQIKQDTIVHRPLRKKITEVPPKRLLQEQADNSHYFSDEFQPLLNTEGAVKYVRPDVSHFELKKTAPRGLFAGAVSRSARVDPAAGEAGAGGADRRLPSRTCLLRLRDARARETHPQAANAALACATSAHHGFSSGVKRVRRRRRTAGAD